jgi:hypothetical protein
MPLQAPWSKIKSVHYNNPLLTILDSDIGVRDVEEVDKVTSVLRVSP